MKRRLSPKKTGARLALVPGKGKRRSPTDLLSSLSPTEEALFGLHEATGMLEKALPPPRFFRAVIFGSARVKEDEAAYEQTRELARSLSEQGIDIVTGGGPGLMEAASRGAIEGSKKSPHIRSWGICIESVYERRELPNAYLNRAYQHGNFFTRLHQFARLGAMGAFIVMPGGIGTLLELVSVWQLLQVKHLRNCPLIVADPMWHDIFKIMHHHAVPRGFVNPDEMMRGVSLVSTPSEALPIVLGAYENFKGRRAAG